MQFERTDFKRAVIVAPSEQAPWANIPPKRNRKEPICFGPCLHRACNLVARFFNKTKQCRRIAARYEKLAAIRIWPHVYESAP
jgi:transposase